MKLILVSIVAYILSACGGTYDEPMFYESNGKCYAKSYFDGQTVINTTEYVEYPGKCE